MFSGTGAAGLTVAIADPSAIAAAGTAGGSLDGSNALKASQARQPAGSADALFTSLVGAMGSASALASQQQSTQARSSRTSTRCTRRPTGSATTRRSAT